MPCAFVMTRSMACPDGTVTLVARAPLQTILPVPLLYTGFESVMMLVVPYFKVAVIVGLAGILPLMTLRKFVIVTRPPDGIAKSWQNAGVWEKLVVDTEPE